MPSRITPKPTQAPRPLTSGPGRIAAPKPTASAPTKPPLLAALTATLVETKREDAGPNAEVPPNIAGVPVRHARTLQFVGLTGTSTAQQQTTDVQFGKLSKDQHKALMAEFGGTSQVPYDAQREYSAIDFLAPMLQALVNKDVDVSSPVTLRGTAKLREVENCDYAIGITPNCHGTAWEAARAFQGSGSGELGLCLGDGTSALDLYHTDRFTNVGKLASGDPAALKQLRPGDLIAVTDESELLLHSAVYAGGGLFFEKPDTEDDGYSETPYRLVTLEQMKAPLGEYANGELSLSIMRPAKPLEPVQLAFQSGEEAGIAAWANKQGTSIGKPLVLELELGSGGGIRGVHASATELKNVTIDAQGRGTVVGE
ncbi:MAG: hypothetical protein HY901_03905 [Deltaproteobacteria bacterium]|nr:hypothetical protein [Deltaproteobacteria bacterium]